MNNIIEAIILTGGMFIVGIFLKEKHKFIDYLFYFLVILGILFLTSPCKANATHFIPISSIEISHFQKKLKPTDIQYYKEKVKFHKENAERTFNDAKNKCWYLPDLTDRENAKYCFLVAMNLANPGDLKSKLICSIVTLLLKYGLDCIDQWDYIDNKLHWSQYHYEMSEFYQQVLDNE